MKKYGASKSFVSSSSIQETMYAMEQFSNLEVTNLSFLLSNLLREAEKILCCPLFFSNKKDLKKRGGGGLNI